MIQRMHEGKNGIIAENFMTESDDKGIYRKFSDKKTSLQL
jgi:hypothetical protein